MFSTSMAAAVSCLMAVSVSTGPNWQTDYRTALAQAAEQQKPVAVFIAAGSNGVNRLVEDGGIGADAADVLKAKYVALYVDTTTSKGKTLAGSFAMDKGLVISDRSGAVQAHRHPGALSQVELGVLLTAYAEPAPAVVASAPVTVAAPVYSAAPVVVSAPVYAPVGGCANGRCGLTAPVATFAAPVATFAAPVVNTIAAPFVGSSCPNGRCPNAR